MMAFVLELGMITILLASMSSAFYADNEMVRDGLRNSRFILYGTIIAVAFGLTIAWVWGERKPPTDG
jgi:hypothetical protein